MEGHRIRNREAYLVIDVCNVHHKIDLELEVIPHDSAYDIRRHVVPSMAQMGIVVDGRATGVPADTIGFPFYGNKQVF